MKPVGEKAGVSLKVVEFNLQTFCVFVFFVEKYKNLYVHVLVYGQNFRSDYYIMKCAVSFLKNDSFCGIRFWPYRPAIIIFIW